MAFIEINADLRKTAAALERIAHALERMCVRGLGVALSEPETPRESKRIDEELSYTSDIEEVRKEVQRAAGVVTDDDEAEVN